MAGTVRVTLFFFLFSSFYTSRSISLRVTVVRDHNCENCIEHRVFRVRINKPVKTVKVKACRPRTSSIAVILVESVKVNSLGDTKRKKKGNTVEQTTYLTGVQRLYACARDNRSSRNAVSWSRKEGSCTLIKWKAPRIIKMPEDFLCSEKRYASMCDGSRTKFFLRRRTRAPFDVLSIRQAGNSNPETRRIRHRIGNGWARAHARKFLN